MAFNFPMPANYSELYLPKTTPPMNYESVIRSMKTIIAHSHRVRAITLRHLVPLLLVFGMTMPTMAQKYEQKKGSDMVTKNGVDYLRIETKGCGFGQPCTFHVFDATGQKVIIITMESFKDPAEVGPNDRDGQVYFSTYHFPTLDKKAEYASVRSKAEKLAKDIDSNGLFNDGILNEEAVNEFVLVNGSKFSQRRDNIIRVISR